MTAEHIESSDSPVTIHTEKVEALNVDLAKALEQDAPSPWSKGYLRLYLMCGLIYLCSTMNGSS